MTGKRQLRRAYLFSVVLIALASSARGQSATPEANRSLTPGATLGISEVAIQAEQVGAVLRGLEASAAPPPEVVAIDARLATEGDVLQSGVDDARAALAASPSLQQLNEIERVWRERAKRLAGWNATLAARAKVLEEQIGRARALNAEWQTIDRRLADAPVVVRDRIAEVLTALAATQQRLEGRRDAELVRSSRVAQLGDAVADLLDGIQRAQGAGRSQLLQADAPPLWQLSLAPRRTKTVGEALHGALAERLDGLRSWLDDRQREVPMGLLLLLAVLAGVFALRRRARAAAGERGQTAALLEHPISVALVVWLFLTPLPYRGAPPLARGSIALVLTVALLRLLPALLPRQQRRPVYALAVFVAIDVARGLIAHLPLVERALFTIEGAVAIALLRYLVSVTEAPARTSPTARAARTGFEIALVGTAVALVANVFGYLSLARLLGDGTVRSAYITVLVYVFGRIAAEALRVLLHTQPVLSLRVVRRRIDAVERGVLGVLRAAVVVIWAVVVLRVFDLLDVVHDALTVALTTEVTFGELSLSLGGVLGFGITIWAALLLSRFVRAVLDDEVLPRLHLSRGVPYAISTTVRYALLLFGFFAALSAAGVPFDRLAIIVGGLGVGVGFGLQNIVNNFVSGTILIFERPIQIGDLVQMDQLIGRVKRIGLRSSTILTPDGAEVIVPNANLISVQLTNWTLSDRRRRFELPVGVAYGTDPERVLGVLVEAARQHREVLKDPPPSALFLGFGASSLDFKLRAWTDQDDEYPRVRSEVAVVVNRALVEAGIEIPFPQQDLHVKTVAAEVSERLSAPTEPEAAERKLPADLRSRR